jgi:ribosomal-protein-alanine N-acetyltransferase
MKLRPATPQDAEILAALHAKAFDPPWNAPAIANVLSGPGAFGLIAEDDAPAGMILARAIAGEAEILTIAVAPGARRSGLGRALVEAVCGLAGQSGAQTLFLEVAVDNAAAIGLYTAAGFTAAGRRRGYYDRGTEGRIDALILRLGLNSEAG